MALVLYAPTIALSSVTNISWWACILLLGVCSTIYTTLGGMKAIVWTDVFQIFIMFGGVLAILIKGTSGKEKKWRYIYREQFRWVFFVYIMHSLSFGDCSGRK